MPHIKSKHKAVGSIIGAVFLMLILIMGFSYLLFNFQQINAFNEILIKSGDDDQLRSLEDLNIVSASLLDGDILNLTLRNAGSYQSHVIWLGLLDESQNTQEYYQLDYTISPGETITNVVNNSATITSGENRVLQLLTDRGNLYTYQYPLDFQGGEGSVGQSTVAITCMGLPYNPMDYSLLGSTAYVSGGTSDIIRNNSSYFSASSYLSGGISDFEYFVNLQSNVDGLSDIGTHNTFNDLTSGPDGIFDSMSEENTGVGGFTDPPKYESYEEAGSAGDVTQIQVNKPSGTVLGDLLFAAFSKDSNLGLLSSPTGWIDLREGGTGTSRVLFSYKIATSAEPATYTFTSTDSDQMCVGIARFSGVDSSDPIDVYSSLNTGVSNSPICPTVTTTVSNTTILRVMGADDDDYSEPGNYPSGYNGIFTAQATGTWGETHSTMAYLTQQNAGSTGTASFSLTASEEWGAMTVTLKPLSSSDNYEVDLEIQWTNVSFTESNEELTIFTSASSTNTDSLDAQGGYMVVGDGSPDWGSSMGTISFWVKWDTVANRLWGQNEDMEFRISGSNLILDWGNTQSITSSTSFVSDKWYFIAVSWNENSDELTLYVGDDTTPPSVDTYIPTWTDQVSIQGVIENSFLASKSGVDPVDGHGDELRYWDIDRSLIELQSDYMTILTGGETNIRSYFLLDNNFNDIGPDINDGNGQGSYSFSSDTPFNSVSENLRVDVWDGDSWELVIPSLTNGWNNVSVSSYLTSPTFTARFRDTDSAGDGILDSWDIDTALLHTWSTAGQQVVEVEFNGSSNVETWENIKWCIDSAFDTGDVNVTLQMYNYSGGQYSTSGDGYLTYLSDSIPNTDELFNQTIISNPERFRGSNGTWKLKIKGEKNVGTPFQMDVDWIEFKPRFEGLGSTIQYDNWQEYRIRCLTWENEPLSYGYVSIFINGTIPSLRDALTQVPLTNPCLVSLDENGEYHFEINSMNPVEEEIAIKTVLGSIMGERCITQQSP